MTTFAFEFLPFYLCFFIFGTVIGSFLCCQARRLHFRVHHRTKKLPKRSICESCKTQLKWYENIPIFSWLFQRGRCRTCGQKIGAAEFFSELLLALAFTGLGHFILTQYFPLDLSGLIILISLIILLSLGSFLAIYDALYGEFPTIILWLTVIVAVLLRFWALAQNSFGSTNIFNDLTELKSLALALLILPGLYLALYLISHEKLVGSGDWILCLAIALTLGEWQTAFLALFLSNLLASLYGFTRLFRKTKNHTVHFGPFLVAGAYLAPLAYQLLSPYIFMHF